MTAVPPRRRQQPLNLDGAWLVTESTEGAKEVPGMSVVADARGFTIVGPEPGTERTIPWELTTGFTCQRPARLPDGSPATMLEVGLANGRVLQLMLPVNRVPPSETVVVETELAVMSERYGGLRAPVSGSETATPQAAAPQAAAPQAATSQSAGKFESSGTLAGESPRGASGVRPAAPDERLERAGTAQRAAGAQPNGSSPNGSSPNGFSSGGLSRQDAVRPLAPTAPTTTPARLPPPHQL